MGFSFPKGNGIKIIKQESEAVTNPSGGSVYILPIDEQSAKIIVVSKSGNKREIEGTLKPTTDGSWVITKSGDTISYTDASTLGQNIANTNLTWSADRTQNLNAKKLSFTGGRVSVPALELEITAENSVPNKIWTAGDYLWHTNNLGISYRVAYDNQVIKTITGNVTLDNTYHNCIVRINATCTITVPFALRTDFNCVFDVIGVHIATFIEGTGVVFSAPVGKILKSNSMGTIYRYTPNIYRLNGGFTTIA